MLSDLYSFAQQYGYTKEDCTVLIISLILPASGLLDLREGVSEVKGEVNDFLSLRCFNASLYLLRRY